MLFDSVDGGFSLPDPVPDPVPNPDCIFFIFLTPLFSIFTPPFLVNFGLIRLKSSSSGPSSSIPICQASQSLPAAVHVSQSNILNLLFLELMYSLSSSIKDIILIFFLCDFNNEVFDCDGPPAAVDSGLLFAPSSAVSVFISSDSSTTVPGNSNGSAKSSLCFSINLCSSDDSFKCLGT